MSKKRFAGAVLVLGIFVGAGYFVLSRSGLMPVQVAQVRTSTNHVVSADDLIIAKGLFEKNNIEMGALAITQVVKDDLGTTHVWGDQFYNGLVLFTGKIGYHFDKSGRHNFTSGERVGDIRISTDPSISMTMAAKIARKKIMSEYRFAAELGIFDISAGTSGLKPNYMLVWKIKPDAIDYPYIIIDARSGSIIRYDDGIRY
ncbi:MAG: hypothetical protein AAB495_01075 [Patescibacteria group bacterium]